MTKVYRYDPPIERDEDGEVFGAPPILSVCEVSSHKAVQLTADGYWHSSEEEALAAYERRMSEEEDSFG